MDVAILLPSELADENSLSKQESASALPDIECQDEETQAGGDFGNINEKVIPTEVDFNESIITVIERT